MTKDVFVPNMGGGMNLNKEPNLQKGGNQDENRTQAGQSTD